MSKLLLLPGSIAILTPMSLDLYLPALPSIAADLQATAGAVQLTLPAFFIGLAISQLFFGSVADGSVLGLITGLGPILAPQTRGIRPHALVSTADGPAVPALRHSRHPGPVQRLCLLSGAPFVYIDLMRLSPQQRPPAAAAGAGPPRAPRRPCSAPCSFCSRGWAARRSVRYMMSAHAP